jgi:two-component system, cell cycle response regulator
MEPMFSVLAVDDQESNLRLVELALEPLGCRVRTATTGKQALAAVHEEQPDVILLDVVLPGMDGFQVCRTLKSDEATRLIPVLLVSGLHSHEDRVKGIEAGCDDFISKPFDAVELRARVRTLARLSYAGLHRREAELLACAVEGLTDGLMIAGEEGEVLLANGPAREILPLPEGAASAASFMSLLTFAYELHPPLAWDELRDLDAHTFSAVRIAAEGSPPLWLQISVRRVDSRRASIAARFVITLRDITREVTDGRVRTPYFRMIGPAPSWVPACHAS